MNAAYYQAGKILTAQLRAAGRERHGIDMFTPMNVVGSMHTADIQEEEIEVV